MVKVSVENSATSASEWTRLRMSWISGTEKVMFSLPMPGALCLM